ncbi:hypothetical protein KBD33_02340 [Candidatus Gracilibacteria bacterium]|nr:hypothetical protein [Candidatus Gracilibacteria bacterium]
MYFKTLFYAILACIPFLNGTSLLYANDDITELGFTISLCAMDPMRDCEKSDIPSGGDALMDILDKFAAILLFSVPLIAGISFIIAGYFYIFSSGDTEKANRGKTIIKWNIIAILVALSSYILVKIVASFFT